MKERATSVIHLRLTLPEQPCVVTLSSPTRLNGPDLSRFLAAGGTIINGGYSIVVDGPVEFSLPGSNEGLL